MNLLELYKDKYRKAKESLEKMPSFEGLLPYVMGSKILDTPSSYIGGVMQNPRITDPYVPISSLISSGLQGVSKRWRGDTSSTVMETLPSQLGLSGVPAFLVGAVGEIGVPDITDIGDVGRIGKGAGKYLGDSAKLNDVAKMDIARLDNIPFVDKLLGDRYSDIKKIAENVHTNSVLSRKYKSLLVEMQDKTNVTAGITKKADDLINNYGKIFGRKSSVVNKVIGDVSNPLIKEAKKYKSAEEFVKSQPIYRGGNKVDFDRFGDEGVSFSTDKRVAKRFVDDVGDFSYGGGGFSQGARLKNNAKILMHKDIPEELLDYKSVDMWGNNIPIHRRDVSPNIIKYAKSNGYDAIDLSAFGEKEILVLNPKAIREVWDTAIQEAPHPPGYRDPTQLTDIWNKANKLKGNK